MKKLILVVISVFFIFGCAPLMTNGTDGQSFTNYAEKTVKGAEWIKGVTDLTFRLGCLSGKIKPKVCNEYDKYTRYASLTIENTKKSIATYKADGTVVSQEQVNLALEELLKIVFKLDTVYKTPAEQIEGI